MIVQCIPFLLRYLDSARISVPAVVILILMLGISGCTPGIDPGPCRTMDCLEETYSLQLFREVRILRDSTVVFNQATAEFAPADDAYPYDSRGVDAGAVTVNAIPLSSAKGSYFGRPHVIYFFGVLGDSLIASPGAINTWQIGGSLEIAPFTLAMNTPDSLLAIASPRIGDTLGTDSLLLVQWTMPGSGARAFDSHHIRIVLTNEFLPFRQFEYKGPDSGEARIPIADIISEGISLGPGVVLRLERTSIRWGITADAHLYGLYFIETLRQPLVFRE